MPQNKQRWEIYWDDSRSFLHLKHAHAHYGANSLVTNQIIQHINWIQNYTRKSEWILCMCFGVSGKNVNVFILKRAKIFYFFHWWLRRETRNRDSCDFWPLQRNIFTLVMDESLRAMFSIHLFVFSRTFFHCLVCVWIEQPKQYPIVAEEWSLVDILNDNILAICPFRC